MDIRPHDLPGLSLRHPDSTESGIDSYLKSETAFGFGSEDGNALLAGQLLDLGLPTSDNDEIALEAEPGSRGVSPGSAEMRFFLPGHVFHAAPIAWP